MGSQITKSKQFRSAFPSTQFRILPSDPCFPDLMILQQMSDSSVLAAVFLGQNHKQNQQNIIKNKHVLIRKQKYQKDKNLYHVYEWATANVQGLVDFTTKIDQKRKITKTEYKAILQGAIRGYQALYRQTFNLQTDNKMECLCINMNNLKIFNQVVLKTNQKNSKEIVNKMIIKVVPHSLNNFIKQQQNNYQNNWPNVGQCIHKGGVLTEKQLLGMYMLQLGNYALKMDFKNKKDNMKNLKINFGSHVERIIDALINDYQWKIIIKELETQYTSETQKNNEQDKILTNQLKNQIFNRQTLRKVQSNQNLYQNNNKITQIQTIQRLQINQNHQKSRKDSQFQQIQVRYSPRVSEIQPNQSRQTTKIQRVQNIQQPRINLQKNQQIGQFSHRLQMANQGKLFRNFQTQQIHKNQIIYKNKQIQQGSQVRQIRPVNHQITQVNQQIKRNQNISNLHFPNIQHTQRVQIAQIAQQFTQIQNKNQQIQLNNQRQNYRGQQRENQRENIKKIQFNNQRQNYQQHQQHNQQINQNIQNYQKLQSNQQNPQNQQNFQQVYREVPQDYHQNIHQNEQKYEQYPQQYPQQVIKHQMTSLKVLPTQKTSTIRIQQKKLPKTQNNLFSFFRKQQQQSKQISQQIISPQDDTSFLQQLNKNKNNKQIKQIKQTKQKRQTRQIKQTKQISRIIIPAQQPDPNIRKQHSRVIIYGNNQQQPYNQYQQISKINRMNSNQYYHSLSPIRTQPQTYISPVSIKNIQQQSQPVLGNSRDTLINKLEQHTPSIIKRTSSILAHINNNQNFTYDQQRGIFISNKLLAQYYSPQPNPTYLQRNNVTPPKRKQSIVVSGYPKQQKSVKQIIKIDKNHTNKKRKGKKISFLISQPNNVLAMSNIISYQTKTKPDFCENQFFIKEQQNNIKQSSNNLKSQIKGFLSHQFNGLGFSLNQKNFNRSSKQANKLQLPINSSIVNHKPKIPAHQIPPRHDKHQKNQQNTRRSLQKQNNMNQKNQKVQYIQLNEHKSQRNHDSMYKSLKNNNKQQILISQSWQLNDQIHLNSNFHQNNELQQRNHERSQLNNNQNNERSQRNNRNRRNQQNQQHLSRNSYNQQQNQQQQIQINIPNHQLSTNKNNEDFNPRKVRSNIQNINIKQANSQILLLGVSKSPKSIKNYNNNNNNNSESNSIVKSEQIIQQRKQSKYIGPVNIKGQKQGQGKIFFLSGGCYIGNFSKDFMHGQGKLYYPSGKLAYEGSFQHDKFHGYGKLYNQSPIYISNFDFRDFNKMQVTQKQQPIHKQHFLINPIKLQKKISYWKMYQGEMMHDMKHGKGILLLENGEKYVGGFVNDLVHGKGTFYGNNSKIEGVWEENMLIQVHR